MGVKNSNKNTPEFLTLSPCVNLWCFLSIFGRFRAIPASFSSAAVLYFYIILITRKEKNKKIEKQQKNVPNSIPIWVLPNYYVTCAGVRLICGTADDGTTEPAEPKEMTVFIATNFG